MIESEILDNSIPEVKIDWNKPQKVISKTNGIVLITNGLHSTNCFEGTCIYNNKGAQVFVGYYSKSWIKDIFIPFEESILIK